MRIVIEIDDDQVETAIERDRPEQPRVEYRDMPCVRAHVHEDWLEEAEGAALDAWNRIFKDPSMSDSQANNVLRMVDRTWRKVFAESVRQYMKQRLA